MPDHCPCSPTALWTAPEAPGRPSCFCGRTPLQQGCVTQSQPWESTWKCLLCHRDSARPSRHSSWEAAQGSWKCSLVTLLQHPLFSLQKRLWCPEWPVMDVWHRARVHRQQEAQRLFLVQAQGSKHGWEGGGLDFTAQLLSCSAPKVSASMKSVTGRDEKTEGRRTGEIIWLSSSKQGSATSETDKWCKDQL